MQDVTPPPAGALLELFGELTGVMFCAKDADGRYTEVNDAFVRRTRERTRAAVIGRRATDLFVPALAERYEEQDAAVLTGGLAPSQFVLRTRIDHARALLGDTTTPLAEVAAACGFHDQPAFTRQFARLAGETPGQYRRRAR